MQSAFCYVLTQGELNSIITSKIESAIKNQVKKYDVEIKTKISGLPTTGLTTQENVMPKIEFSNVPANFQPNLYTRVTIKNSKNAIIASYSISAQTKLYKDILVANQQITYNQTLNQANTRLEKREVTNILGNTISSLDDKKISTRTFMKDNAILASGVKSKATVLKDSNIDIIFLSQKGLRIKLQGKALKDGAIGDVILVRSSKYNKTYSATVNSENEVTVRI